MSLERPEKEYIQQMADRRVEHYRKHYRSAGNEWILEELEEWADEVHIAAEMAFKHGKMSKKEFQETVMAARSAWITARKEIEQYVSEEDYLARLTGKVGPSD